MNIRNYRRGDIQMGKAMKLRQQLGSPLALNQPRKKKNEKSVLIYKKW